MLYYAKASMSVLEVAAPLCQSVGGGKINKCMEAVVIQKGKSCDMLWKEGLLIKLHMMGVGELLFFNRIKDYLLGQTCQISTWLEMVHLKEM